MSPDQKGSFLCANMLQLVWLVALSSRSPCEMGQGSQRRMYRRRRSVTVICRPCAPGQHGAAPGTCLPCPSAQWQAEAGQLRCDGSLPCPVGRYGPLGSTTPQSTANCRACPAGQFQPLAGMGGCGPCPAGTAADTEGSSRCHGTPCAPGTSGPTGQTQASGRSCRACEAGQASARAGQAQCQPCPAGQWQPRTAQAACVVQPTCGAYTYWAAGTCRSAHPYLKTLVIGSWSIFALNLVSMCCCPGPDRQYRSSAFVLIFVVSLACGIITSQRRSPMSSGMAHVLAGLLGVVGMLLLERLARALLRAFRRCR